MTPSTSIRRNLFAALNLIGFGVSVYQSTLFYAIRGGTAGFKSACNLGKSMNCDVVMTSRWAELVLGIPLSSFAAGWFLALFVVAMFARNAFWRRDALRVAAYMSGFAALMSLAYLAVMMTAIRTLCLFCLVVDASALIGLAIVLSMRSEWTSQVKPDAEKMKTLLYSTAGALVAAVGILTLLIAPASRYSDSDLTRLIEQVLASPKLEVASGPEHASIGPMDAPVTIVEFSDFQCPHCRIGALYMTAVMNRYPGKVRLVARNYPLDPACNPKVTSSMHPAACAAAKTAVCAAKQGKFHEVFEQLFENQTDIGTTGDRQPEAMAAAVGADEQALRACVASPETQLAIARDVEEATRLGVESTPTFFINGHKVEGAYPIPAWYMMIDRLLAGK
jgi:protein-disulfide isomerase